ncbi:MAG: hypothetical protein AB8G22_07575 [Saprospiraceae bacterium]
MIIRIFTFLICIFSFNIVSAQFLYPNYLKGDLTKKQFIFTDLPETRTAIFQKKKDESESEESNSYEFWQEYLEEYWYLTDDYQVLPFDEAYAISQKDKKNTYLVQIGRLESSSYGSIYTLLRVMSPFSPRGQTAYSVVLGYQVEAADIVYGLLNLQETFTNRSKYTTKFTPKSAVKVNGKMLKEKTLYYGYVKSAKDKKKIKENYPYASKLASSEEIESAILEKKEGILVIRQFQLAGLVNTPKSNFVVYSTSDGAIVTHAIAKNISGAMKAFANDVK